MGKHFWPLFVAVAAISCALVWRYAPALGARLPPEIRANICRTVDSAVAAFSSQDTSAESVAEAKAVAEAEAVAETGTMTEAEAVAASCAPPVRSKSVPALVGRDTRAPYVRRPLDPNRPPSERGVRPVDPIHAAWCVLTDITPVERLDGSPIGNVSGGRFFKIEKTISTPSGLMVIGTFIPKTKSQTVRIPVDKISCFSGVPGFLSTNQQTCLRKYYELTGAAEALKARLLREAAKKSPYLQDAADALRELRAKEKSVEKMRSADADTLRKTTYEISQLRVKVQELNQKHKEWKAEHAAEMPNPADDPAYREIIDRRRRYAEPIPGLTL